MRTYFLIFSTILTTSCVHAQAIWEKDAPDDFVPKEATRLSQESIFVVGDADFDKASKILSKQSFVKLTDEEAALFLHLPTNRVKDGTKKYLVRSVFDYRNGMYTAFIENGKLLVLWGGFGSCGRLVNSALMVRLKEDIQASYTSCTGVE
ncbi:MAG TPA: hypothetical protein VJ806_06270 [Luteimonas sp.]|nr:hypothetical protein [Luteimonas sp.]